MLKKWIMDAKIKEDNNYNKDPRTPCKYGTQCYQKNSAHLSKYKHPPKKGSNEKNNIEPPRKKQKINTTEIKGNSENGNEGTSNAGDKASTSVETKKDYIQPQSRKQEIDNTEIKENTEKSEGPSNAVDKVSTSVENVNLEETKNDIKIESKIYVPLKIDEKEFIKSKFLVDMPPDFYSFWNFCKNLNDANPLMALNDVGLALVGPFEVLAGKFNNTAEKKIEEYVLHWRFFYDPPEFQTVIKRNDNSGYHLGYFRDSPDEMPVFLAYNFVKTDGTFTVVGDNLFAAVSSFLKFLMKNSNPFIKGHVVRYNNLIQKEAEKLKMSLSVTSSKISTRNKKILSRTFNKLGIVVPYNKTTQVGYRPLSISNKELQILLTKIKDAADAEKDQLMIQLQDVLTNTNIAIDECDFGTGLELGLDILCAGVESLNSVALRFLSTSYRLLNREAFAIIAESHMKKREKDFKNLSVL